MNFIEIITKLFGNKAQKDMRAVRPYVDKINAAYAELQPLSNDALRARTEQLKERIAAAVKPLKDEIASLKGSIEALPIEKREAVYKKVDDLEKDIKKEDTTCVFTVDAKPEFIEQNGFVFEFNYPLVENGWDSVLLEAVNPKQQKSRMKYHLENDPVNLRRFTIWPSGKFQEGWEYTLRVPHRKFRDINGFYNDSLNVKVSLPKDEKASSLNLNLKGTSGKTYIVDLMPEKMDNVIRTYTVTEDGVLPFPYLKAGSYCIRITEDANKNGLIDTGCLLEHRQPEKVRLYQLSGGGTVIKVEEKTDIDQDIDLNQLFSNQLQDEKKDTLAVTVPDSVAAGR